MTLRRYRTLDREATPIFTTEQIGPKRHKTPEGYLLCEDVPLARVGTMFYGPNETPIKTRDGIARVSRTADTLFDERTIASLSGKPVTDNHPEYDVNPTNWKKYSRGIVINPRRGTGDNADVIMGDLLIMDAATISDVEAGKREVSLGYDAEYVQTGDGEGEQRNILCNHVALVEKGRCGPRCAIGDQQTIEQEHLMPGTTAQHAGRKARKPLPPALRRIVLDAIEDPSLLDEVEQTDTGIDNAPPGGDNDTHVHVHMHGGPNGPADIDPAAMGDQPPAGDPSLEGAPGGAEPSNPYEERFQAIEGTLAQIMEMLQGAMGSGEVTPEPDPQDPGANVDPGGADPTSPEAAGGEDPDKTKDMKTMDSAALNRGFQQLMSDAEVLVPGYRLPTFDSAAPRRLTVDRMCQARRGVLSHLMATQPGRTLVESVAGAGFDINNADCAAAAQVFQAAAGAKRLLNNAALTRDASGLPKSVTQAGATGGIKSIAELNAANRAYWESRKPKI